MNEVFYGACYEEKNPIKVSISGISDPIVTRKFRDIDDALDWLLCKIRNRAAVFNRGFIRKIECTGAYHVELHEWIVSASGIINDEILEGGLS